MLTKTSANRLNCTNKTLTTGSKNNIMQILNVNPCSKDCTNSNNYNIGFSLHYCFYFFTFFNIDRALDKVNFFSFNFFEIPHNSVTVSNMVNHDKSISRQLANKGFDDIISFIIIVNIFEFISVTSRSSKVWSRTIVNI